MKLIAALLCSVLLVFGSALAQDNPRDKLMRVDQAWSAAAAEGQDVEKVVAFWSDDAQIVPAGGPIISGKAAIRDYVAQSFATPGFRISWKTLEAAVSDDGTMGYTTAESTITFLGADGQPVTETGRGVAIWRRDPSGDWKCVYDAWNHGPKAGA